MSLIPDAWGWTKTLVVLPCITCPPIPFVRNFKTAEGPHNNMHLYFERNLENPKNGWNMAKQWQKLQLDSTNQGLLLENVVGFQSSVAHDRLRSALDDAGYDVFEKLGLWYWNQLRAMGDMGSFRYWVKCFQGKGGLLCFSSKPPKMTRKLP